MTQEIEGKLVKVLPLLYKKCDLPSFLKGKLYANFTREEDYIKNLKKILERMGITSFIQDEEIYEKTRVNEEKRENQSFLERTLNHKAVILISIGFLQNGQWVRLYFELKIE